MASKKAAKKGHKHDHDADKDLRRAYEHLGRLNALEGNLPKAVTAQIHILTEMARMTLLTGDTKSSAELLRAGEHLAFGALASSEQDRVGEALQGGIDTQYERLLEKAAERWDEHNEQPGKEIADVYEKTLAAAESAYRRSAYRKALELARAAEALTHANTGAVTKLEKDRKKKSKKLES